MWHEMQERAFGHQYILRVLLHTFLVVLLSVDVSVVLFTCHVLPVTCRPMHLLALFHAMCPMANTHVLSHVCYPLLPLVVEHRALLENHTHLHGPTHSIL